MIFGDPITYEEAMATSPFSYAGERVYLIEIGDNVKIGSTGNVVNRIHTHCRSAFSIGVRIGRVLVSSPLNRAMDVEKCAHSLLDSKRLPWAKEVFSATLEDARDAVSGAAEEFSEDSIDIHLRNAENKIRTLERLISNIAVIAYDGNLVLATNDDEIEAIKILTESFKPTGKKSDRKDRAFWVMSSTNKRGES